MMPSNYPPGVTGFEDAIAGSDEPYVTMRDLRAGYDEIPADERNTWPGYVEQMVELGLVGFEVDDDLVWWWDQPETSLT